MRHVRSLNFEPLETRKLLTTVHPGVPKPAAVQATPIVLDGTLHVSNNKSKVSRNNFSDTTTSLPVAGALGGYGKVRGTWNETWGNYGEYLGPDTIHLKNSQGSFTITFDASHNGKAFKGLNSSVYYKLVQTEKGGTGVFADTHENGLIELNTNSGDNQIDTLKIVTKNKGL